MSEPGGAAAAAPVREWRRRLAARLFMLIAATGMTTAFLSSPCQPSQKDRHTP
ncbi:hypothetical protein ABZ114_18920 [Streptomyces albidoflavus]|uniref:hypothetical protein n=1 Tax=Streptomyces albidoflavus TaxID=1886 RepID=UPI0033ABF455